MQAATSAIPSPSPHAALPGAYPWLPDQGDGTYCNPILHADYSDPDAIRVGDDFWMTASSFNCTPGLPILHSRDLVNWTLVGHALKNLPHPRYGQVQPGCGVWAPAIRHHAGRYWIFFPTPDEGLFLVTADHPAGPWSEPHCLQEGKGLIDPCPLWDDDGQAYLVHAFAGSRAGIKHRLCVRPMAPDGSRLLGPGQIVFHHPAKHPTLEGPKFLKRDGWYYILAPAGGVEAGWQVALRSRQIYGPYEDRIVLAQGTTPINGPHQGALVDTPEGDWWFLHFQDAGVYGRIVHLQPVQWQDGWPVMGRHAEPVARYPKPRIVPGLLPGTPDTTDEFTDTKLGPQWQWQANHRDDWHSLTARPGWLRLFAQPTAARLNEQPNLLLQKLPARQFSVETSVDLADGKPVAEAGLVVMGRAFAALALRRTQAGTQIVFRGDADRVMAETVGATARLRVLLSDGGTCEFSYLDAAGHWRVLPEKFAARAGVWIGAKLGLYIVGTGHADFDYLRFKPTG